MKILLVQPPLNPSLIGAGLAYLTEPLSLEVIAASVPEHEVEIFDLRLENDLEGKLASFRPAIVGTTACTTDVYQAMKIMKTAKDLDPAVTTVIGGHHATMVPGDFDRAYVDVVVIGEGEAAFREIVAAREAGRGLGGIRGTVTRGGNGLLQWAPPRECPVEIGDTPLPARHLTARYRERYFRGSWRPLASVTTSRGCPFRCRFCAMWKVTGGRYLARSPESVADELAAIAEPYIDFAEDNVFHDVARAEKMCRLITGRGIRKSYKIYARSDTVVRHPELIEHWREAGMKLVLVGFESFRDEELKGLNKGNTVRNNEEAVRILQANGVEIAAYFIVQPGYDRHDFEELGAYVRKLGLTQPIFTVLTPLPGTELYAERSRELTTHNYELYDFLHPVLPTKLPLEEFYASLLELYRACYAEARSGSFAAGADAMLAKLRASLLSAHRPGFAA